ncbi:MAG: hypothetical protein ACJ72E_02105 [Marmoricola sp.]
MSGNDESGWDDDPLVRALRAPGSAEELAEESEFVAAFHAARPRGGSARRIAGRIGLGATTAVATVALSAGMAAAAYTRVLPEPVQGLAHTVFGALGVPDTQRHHRAPQAGATHVPAATPTHGASAPSGPVRAHGPSAHPTRGATRPAAPAPPTAPPPVSATGPTTPPATTGAGTPVRVPAAITATTPQDEVPVGTSVAVTGVVTSADGHTLRNRRVRLMSRSGSGPWIRVAHGTTDAEGRVTVDSPALQANTRLRLVVKGIASPALRIVVDPVLSATVSEAGGSTTVTVVATGGRPGDLLRAFRRQGTALVSLGTVRLDANGTATITVPTPKHRVRVLLRLPATARHAKADTTVLIGS